MGGVSNDRPNISAGTLISEVKSTWAKCINVGNQYLSVGGKAKMRREA